MYISLLSCSIYQLQRLQAYLLNALVIQIQVLSPDFHELSTQPLEVNSLQWASILPRQIGTSGDCVSLNDTKLV